MTKVLLITFSLFAFNSSLFAADFLVVEGRLTDSTGQSPVEAANVDFTLEILSDDANECVLYSETHNSNDMTGTKGFFSLKLGQGAPVVGAYGASMDNTVTHPTGLTCVAGNSYFPTANSSRKLRITYNSGSGAQTLDQLVDIGASQYANYAYSLQGLSANQFVQINGGANLTQTNLEALLTGGNYAELVALASGSSNQYVQASGGDINANSNKLINVATPTLGTDGTNKNYVDQNIGGQAVDAADLAALSAGNNGEVLTWDGTQWVSQTAVATDSTKLPLDGTGVMTGNLDLGGNSIVGANAGTAAVPSFSFNGSATTGIYSPAANEIAFSNSGSQSMRIDAAGMVDMSQSLSVVGGIGVGTGINSGGMIQLENQNQLHFSDADNSNFVSFRSPATVVADVFWTLPDADGTVGQVLQTDGSGNLSWATAGGADNLGNHIATTDMDLANNSLLNLEPGTSAAPGISFNGDSNTGLFSPAADVLSLSTAGIEGLVLDPSGHIGVGTSTPSERLVVEGAIVSGQRSGAAGEAGSIRLRELNANGVNYVGFRSPDNLANTTLYTLPSFDGTSGQVLQTDGGGVLSWVNSGGVSTVFGRSGAVVATAGDYSANFIDNTPTGNIASTDVQGAIDELDNEKMSTDGSNPMTGNFDLGGNFFTGLGAGTAAGPSLSFAGDANTGVYQPAADEISFVTAGIERVRVLNSGTLDVLQDLNVSGNAHFSSDAEANNYRGISGITNVSANNHINLQANESDGSGTIAFRFGSGNALEAVMRTQGQFVLGGNTFSDAQLEVRNPASSVNSFKVLDNGGSEDFLVRNTGHVMAGIGANTPSAKFNVDNDESFTDIVDFRDNSNTSAFVLKETGQVGLGITNPNAKLDLGNGEILLGNEGAGCSAPRAGAVRYNAGILQLCDGTAWQNVVNEKECVGAYVSYKSGPHKLCIRQINSSASGAVSTCRSSAGAYPGRLCSASEVMAAVDEGSVTGVGNSLVGDIRFTTEAEFFQINGAGVPTGSVPVTDAAANDIMCCY